MKSVWKLQDAKSQFSRVVEDAIKDGPQYVTRRGMEAVVVVSTKDYEKLLSHRPSFKDFLLSCPKMEDDFEFARQKDFPRSLRL
jgi:antitoxin Phd